MLPSILARPCHIRARRVGVRLDWYIHLEDAGYGKEVHVAELSMPEVGAGAPNIHAETATGGVFDLAEHRGTWVVVYFFPRASTPG